MMEEVAKLITALALPLVVFVVAGTAMIKISGRDQATAPLREEGITPLNVSPTGYDRQAFDTFYVKLGKEGRESERLFLELDLIFPFLYCGALAGGLLILWIMAERPLTPALFFSPVFLASAADWVENLVHLKELNKYGAGDVAALSEMWILVASVATVLKIWLIILSVLMLIGLFVYVTVRLIR